MKFKILFVSVVCLLCLPMMLLARPTTVSSIRISSNIKNTRVVFVLSKPVRYRVFTLTKPNRIVLDLKNTNLKFDVKKLSLSHTPITKIRTAKNGKDNYRVVFETKSRLKPDAFLLRAYRQYRDRLVVDMIHSRRNYSASVPKKLKPKVTVPLKSAGRRDIIVVIDAGHGGKDPGATGPRGTHEKNVVLSISRYLYQDLKRQPGMKPVLTRRGNYYIALRQRLRIAREAKADIFVSIHADAFRNPRSRGASVYALSQRGASSEAARWLAARENYSELGGVELNNLQDQGQALRSVLIDLSQTASTAESLQIGASVLKQLGKLTRLHHSKVEQARFVVLKSPDIPSILVETGFISNPREERKLASKDYQQKIAWALFQGIKQYFLQHPPMGTLFAAMKKKQGMSYVVVRGDTLSDIAARYGTNVRTLVKYNNLRNKRVYIGQHINIPMRGAA